MLFQRVKRLLKKLPVFFRPEIVVVAPACTAVVAKHIITVKKQGSKVHCYFLESNDNRLASDLPSDVKVSFIETSLVNSEALFQQAFDYAKTIISDLEVRLPDCFEIPGMSCNLKPAFSMMLQYALASSEFSILHYLSSRNCLINVNRADFINFSVTKSIVEDFLSTQLLKQPNLKINIVSTLDLKGVEDWARKLDQRCHEEYPPQHTQNSALVIVGNERTTSCFVPAVAIIAKRFRLNLLCYESLFSLDDETLASLGDQAIPCRLTMEYPIHPELWKQVKDKVFRHALMIQSQFDSECQIFCFIQLKRLLAITKTFLILEALIQTTQPAVVMGCLESNVFGPLTTELKKQYPFHLFNFQHGNKFLTQTLQYMLFDRYFLWNSSTRDIVLQDGYSKPDSLVIIGNPKYEQMQQQISTQPTSVNFKALTQWKGQSRLIGVYSQYLKGSLTHQVKHAFLNAIFNYLRHDQSVRLIIRKHPSEKDTIIQQLIASFEYKDRILIQEATDLPLLESFKAVDLVTSVYSTVLMDALAVGVQAVAMDFNGILSRQASSLYEAMTVVTRPEDVNPTLKYVLYGEGAVPGSVHQGNLTSRGEIFPHFQDTYKERFCSALHDTQVYQAG